MPLLQACELIPKCLTFASTPMSAAGNRFLDTFEFVWRRIPETSRIHIASYLAAHHGWVYMCYKMDAVEQPTEAWGRSAWGNDITYLMFLAPLFELVSTRSILEEVVAHELAHCCNKGRGLWTEDEQKEERQTRELTESWGWRPTVLSQSNLNEINRRIDDWRRIKRSRYSIFNEKRWIVYKPGTESNHLNIKS